MFPTVLIPTSTSLSLYITSFCSFSISHYVHPARPALVTNPPTFQSSQSNTSHALV